MTVAIQGSPELWRLIVVGGSASDTGKTQLVCDVIQAFPKVNWIAGKITLVDEATGPVCWASHDETGTDPARFLAAGATRSFSLQATGSSPADCLTRLRRALHELPVDTADSRKKALIFESESLAQFVKAALYFVVIDPDREEFSESTQAALERANALVLKPSATEQNAPPAPLWMKVPPKLLQQRPSVLLRQGEPLSRPLESLIHQMVDDPPSVAL